LYFVNNKLTPQKSLDVFLTDPTASDCFTDVPGLRLGHAVDARINTGVTVIIPALPVVMGVDVRGGAPGTRDTPALDPGNLVERVHGLVLSGGSVFGLAAADVVTCWLSEQGIGLPSPARTIPVVPQTILFDLANGGNKAWGMSPPYHRLALDACAALGTDCPHGRFGAGYGAIAGSRPGGLGSASVTGPQGYRVAALIAVNSFGEVYADAPPLGEVPLPKVPPGGKPAVGQNTTIGVIATDAPVSKAQAQRLAIMAQDGLARCIRPIHTQFDGDTLFALSTAREGLAPVDALTLSVLGTLAADCVVRAVRRAVGIGPF
jgi:L-aminopeptidase/D-esterase-like protein